jgi:hypothetical protein
MNACTAASGNKPPNQSAVALATTIGSVQVRSAERFVHAREHVVDREESAGRESGASGPALPVRATVSGMLPCSPPPTARVALLRESSVRRLSTVAS